MIALPHPPDALTIDETAVAIRAAVARVPGLSLEKVIEARGRYAAVFEARPNATYTKGFATAWHPQLSELLCTVLDTLEHVQGDVDMNIFSAQMFEFLSAEMLPNDGRSVTLTIKAVNEETVAGPRGEQVKVIVTFRERPKKLILNKTNARALARALGPETEAWAGAAVVLGVESVKVGKNTVPSIRVKSAAPPVQQQPAQPRARRPAQQPSFADVGAIPPAQRADEDEANYTGVNNER
jgi:hypothetical protein